jgi:hypothetical protein
MILEIEVALQLSFDHALKEPNLRLDIPLRLCCALAVIHDLQTQWACIFLSKYLGKKQ